MKENEHFIYSWVKFPNGSPSTPITENSHYSEALMMQVLTRTCALGQSPLLCSQLLFLLQVEDEAGFPHLTPYSRGKIHVEGGSCRGHVF